MRRGWATFFAVFLGAPSVFAAGGAAPSAERLKSAAAEYDAGRRAFTDQKFEEAAIHFENAYHDAPNAQTLRNAIRARHDAKELARAATLAVIAQDRYADDDATVKFAKETLQEAAPKLEKVTIVCEPECGVASDNHSVSLEDVKRFTFFLNPGEHNVVVSWPGDRSKQLDVHAKEGEALEKSFTAPPMPVTSVAQGGTGLVVVEKPSSKPFGPAVFITLLSLTAVAGGILVWSGIDTINNPGTDAVRNGCVGQGPGCPLYQQGLDEQTRTNVLIGVTGGLGLLTFVSIFLTQWSHPKEAAAAHVTVTPTFGLGSVGLAGRF
ncbi:MAG TPA: hypothetical protein VGH28_32150 [Polyangiaceae bacterium]|jgi:hypothetical protein